MDDMPAWVKTPGGVERQHRMNEQELELVVLDDVLAQAKYDLSWALTELYPSSTVPKDIVVSVARRRVIAAERMLRVASKEVDWKGTTT